MPTGIIKIYHAEWANNSGKRRGGYGFIAQDGGEPDLFFHKTQFPEGAEIIEGAPVGFETQKSTSTKGNGRMMAVDIQYL